MVHDGIWFHLSTPADLAEAERERPRVIEVCPFETEPHRRHERDGALRGRHALPEPVAHREIPHPVPQPLDVRRVHTHMAHLVARNAKEPLAKLARRFDESEESPRHKLGGLKLVMEERMQRPSARERRAEPSGLGRLCDET